MSWFQKILRPKINRRETDGVAKKVMPEGLWSKCPTCETVLYRADLENNLEVCPKCGHHHRIDARARLAMLLDAEDQQEIGANVTPLDTLKFKDSKRYIDRLTEAQRATEEKDALIVMRGSILSVPVVVAAFEFKFMGGSMGEWWANVLYAASKPVWSMACRLSVMRPAAEHACRKDCSR